MQAWYLNENPYPVRAAARPRRRGLRARRACRTSTAIRRWPPTSSRRRSTSTCSATTSGSTSSRTSTTPGSTVSSAPRPLILGVLARQTKNVRILSLGHAHHRAEGSRAHRRGVRDGGRDVSRAARDRLREVGRQRDGVGQREPDRHRRPLLGGDRPDPQDALASRGAVQLGGEVLHAPPRQHLAGAVAAAAPAAVGGHGRSRRRRPSSDGAASSTSWSSAASRRR